MSAPNFINNQLGFPLYVRGYCYSKRCPECGAWNGADADECEECGENLSAIDAEYDEFETEYMCDEIGYDLKSVMEKLDFFTVEVIGGRYDGLQLNVEWNKRIGDPEDLDNDDAHYYFDCCRSEMLRRYQRERKRLGKKLKEIADFYGFEEIVCVGIFSNGEAVYERAGTLRAAANAI